MISHRIPITLHLLELMYSWLQWHCFSLVSWTTVVTTMWAWSAPVSLAPFSSWSWWRPTTFYGSSWPGSSTWSLCRHKLSIRRVNQSTSSINQLTNPINHLNNQQSTRNQWINQPSTSTINQAINNQAINNQAVSQSINLPTDKSTYLYFFRFRFFQPHWRVGLSIGAVTWSLLPIWPRPMVSS